MSPGSPTPMTAAPGAFGSPPGEDAVARLGDAGARGMQLVLADWSPCELRQLADLFHRMVDVFLAHPLDEGSVSDAGATTPAA